jgi:hypothetical protein
MIFLLFIKKRVNVINLKIFYFIFAVLTKCFFKLLSEM